MYQKLYNFKQKVEDFQVEEVLHQNPEGTGDVFFVFFEKIDQNTMFIVDTILKETGLLRKDIGIAGLKDKQAITKQRISIYKSKLEKIGGEEVFLNILKPIVTILETTWGETPLCVGVNKANNFQIRLRATKHLNKDNFEDVKEKINDRVEYINKNGFPNCFGTQRFGKGDRNFHLSKKIFEAGVDGGTDNAFHIRFKLQAYASMYFNNYALQRYNKGQYFVEGDIIMDGHHAQFNKVGVYKNGRVAVFDYRKCKKNYKDKEIFYPDFFEKEFDKNYINQQDKKRIATGPMIGYNLVLAPNGSKSFMKEREIIKKTDFLLNGIKVAKEYSIWGIRRPLVVYPENFEYSFDEKFDLILKFTLPVGSYATTLISRIFKDINKATCHENGLVIPDIVD